MNYDKLISRAVKELSDAGHLTAQIDARVLLRHTLNQDDVYLITHNTELVTNSQYQKFRRMIRRRKKGEPIAYLTGQKEFYGLDFIVNKNVLIPRPETETLVSEALKFLVEHDKLKLKRSGEITIIDIGTGSGCIIVSLLKALTQLSLENSFRIYASDVSNKALKTAKSNAKKHGLDKRVQFRQSDLLANKKLPKRYDLIISNLPYLTNKKTGIIYTTPSKIGLEFEPALALYASEAGFSLVKRLISELPARLTANGFALLEVSPSHSKKIVRLCEDLGLMAKDIAGNSNHQGFWSIRRKV